MPDEGAGSAAGAPLVLQRFERDLLGVRAGILVWAPEVSGAGEAVDAAFEEALELEALASAWVPGSELSRLNVALREAREHRVSPELAEVLRLAAELQRRTGGAFDPAIGSVLEAQGYYEALEGGSALDADLRERLRAVVGAGAWSVGARPTEPGERLGEEPLAADAHGAFVMTGTPGVRFDLGALLKGLAADRMAEVLRRKGCERALIDLGSSTVLALESPPGESGWAYRLELADQVLEWSLRNESVSVSGQLGQPVFLDGRLVSHLIDPRTLSPVDHDTLKAAARHASAAVADAFSTATSVLGAREAAASYVVRGEAWALRGTWVERVDPSAAGGRVAETLAAYADGR